MGLYRFGNPDADAVLIQPVDDHDLAAIERETAEIQRLSHTAFQLIAFRVSQWNTALSPWKAPAVFGSDAFGGSAAETLAGILQYTEDRRRTYYIGGYSLAGLFALWAAYQTGVFSGAAAASPSVWFPGFTDFARQNRIRTGAVYLSLGDREARTRNPVMAAVENNIRTVHDLLCGQGIPCVLEWNPGNHFRDADLRTAKAFAWVLQHGKSLPDTSFCTET